MTKEEYIKERNELAKQIYISANALTPKEALYRADRWMQNMYGFNLEKFGHSEQKNHIVSIAEKDGIKGVRLCVGDVDIFIEPHNLDNGREYDWNTAISRLRDVGKDTFNLHQAYIIAAFKEKINEKLREVGGDELNDLYWSSTEYSSTHAWYMSFSSGYIFNYRNNYYTCVVRPVSEF